jgi:HEAT repeat protein
MGHKDLVAKLKCLLDRLWQCRNDSSDEREAIYDEVLAEARQLPRDGILAALDEAIGESKQRRDVAVYVLSEWTDLPDVIERIDDWLHDPNPEGRSWLIQTIAGRRLHRLGPRLASLIEHDPDEFCKDMAIHAAGTLRDMQCLPILLRLAQQCDPKLNWRLAETLSRYATVECEPFLKGWFEDTNERKSTRIFAAWGLGKLGNMSAVTFLIEMLDDPDERGPSFYRPGESIRAAQALCDMLSWPFEWNKSYVAATKERIASLKEPWDFA